MSVTEKELTQARSNGHSALEEGVGGVVGTGQTRERSTVVKVLGSRWFATFLGLFSVAGLTYSHFSYQNQLAILRQELTNSRPGASIGAAGPGNFELQKQIDALRQEIEATDATALINFIGDCVNENRAREVYGLKPLSLSDCQTERVLLYLQTQAEPDPEQTEKIR